jgi:predicted esterase
METRNTRRLALVILCLSLAGMIYYSVDANSNYTKAKESASEIQSDIHIEVIRITADDGIPLKALYYIDPLKTSYTNYSTPIIFVCHGMSGEWTVDGSLIRTMVKMGYAVVSPEFRGHGDNPAPSTLGFKEFQDVISWLDYVEKFPAINSSAAAIYGHSMGGLYAIGAYIQESLGKGRFHAVASGAGPLNITREIMFLTNNAEPLGPISLITHMEEKNPILKANSTFPENVYLYHGTEDNIVDSKCTEDFHQVLNPYNNRTDVDYDVIEGLGHRTKDEYTKKVIAWLDYYVTGNETQAEDITLLSGGLISAGAAKSGRTSALYATIACIIGLPALLYFLKPSLFSVYSKKEGEEESNNKKNDEIEENKDKNTMSFTKLNNLKLYGGFLLTNIVAGLISWLIPIYIIFKLLISVLFTAIYVVVLVKRVSNKEKERVKHIIRDMINPKNALLCTLPIIVGLYLYAVIISASSLVDATFVSGIRITWWIPYVTFVFSGFLTVNMTLIRIIRPNFPNKLKKAIYEPIIMGLLTGVGMACFLLPIWGAAYLIIPAWFSFNVDFVLTISLGFGVIFMVFNIIIKFSEKFIKSIIPAVVGLSLIIPMFVAATTLIFFY